MRFVVAIVVLVGVARADDDLDVRGRDSTELRGDAYVWEDSAFYFEPWDGGTQVRFTSSERTRREHVGRAVPVKIISADAAAKSLRKVEITPAEHRFTKLFPRPPSPVHFVPRGTPISTFGGREVGLAAEPILVHPPANDRACFDATITLWHLDDQPPTESGRSIRLCAPASAANGLPVSTPKQDPSAAPDGRAN